MFRWTDHWEFFNWAEIIREAKLRHTQALEHKAVAPKDTLEYWTAWCAHANAVSVYESDGQTVGEPSADKRTTPE